MPASQPQGFLAIPSSGKGPGVLVLHAWWGLNDTFKGVCKRLADAGFVAFAPDLYHGKVVATIPEAEKAVHDLDGKQAGDDVADAARFLFQHPGTVGRGLAVIGFSLGANFALDLSASGTEGVRSVVLFYGTGGGDFSKSRAAYLGHFAENDPFEPKAGVDELEATLKSAGRPVTFHRYPGTGHWFFEPDRPDAYNRAAADLAWDRTVAFLKGSASS